MVPLNTNSTSILLSEVYRILTSQLREVDRDSVDCAFAAWVYVNADRYVQATLPQPFSVTNYQHVAQLAFLSEQSPNSYSQQLAQLEDGLKRVAGRQITMMSAEPAPFRNDPVALLGLALGARRVGGDLQREVKIWMTSFIDVSNTILPEWKRMILAATLALVGAPVSDHLVRPLTATPDIRLALESKGIALGAEIDLEQALQTISHASITEVMEGAVLAIRLQALEYLTSSLPVVSLSRPSVMEIIALLERVPAALKRWPWEDKAKTNTSSAQQWDLQHEYHVQSFLYALLAPIFADIESEFYLESTGQLNPRADLGMPCLNLLIEVKFLRPGVSFARMIEELASDASLYFQKDGVFRKKYSRMLVFLWDDSARNQEHDVFKRGVKNLPNCVGVVVISRPGNMPIRQRSSGADTRVSSPKTGTPVARKGRRTGGGRPSDRSTGS